MKVTIAYIEEPPFGWTEADGTATGADLELAATILRQIGVTRIEYCPTTFGELLPGVASGHWDMNVPLFVTPQRAHTVAFSVPVWGIEDGFLVRPGNPKALRRYASIAERPDARLGIIAGQVQHDSAIAAGVSRRQIVVFEQQADAIAAVLSGVVDAYASTALGNRIVAGRIGSALIEAVAHESDVDGSPRTPPLGAFSFNRENGDLLAAFNQRLRSYVGSPDHRARMARFGLTAREIDPAVLQTG
ncbi:transporter substrate-binding domain-containing protein [Burkholderia cenocepacia]|uniref:transporter substrate-binding domain-containing protein n=1 Tax=Burkholderia cenocepacia TaxID=95486 RepID=UPI0002344733|nr:transporter substrate-binding domain-containing protein [Burkholderia cenocepacia]MDN7827460.1 transporter substrate-binding domain-containing protein [Burkholderia cenocepacia]CDN64847.1 Extracellular solute-binding protein, family 3 [Burkholderia cenocepacia H111]HEM9000278.1 transporter substrate-binding domain-containing protein [Burkholderia cenocepacia]